MNTQEILVGLLIDENSTLTWSEVCHHCNITEEVLSEWMEHGLLGESTTPVKKMTFNVNMLSRIHAAHRLHRELEVNIQGVILALDLLDEITKLEEQLAILKRSSN